MIPYISTERKGIEFLNSKKDWLVKHLPRIEKQFDGFYFFGTTIYVKQNPELKKKKIYFSDEEKILYVPANGYSDEEYFLNWLKSEALNYIPARTNEIANEHKFSFNRITIRNQKTRWGSCNSRRNLSFNMRLMTYPPEIIEYVIVHELCHLKEMNHSKKFWLLVEEILPEYKLLRKQLKNCVL